ncbi:BEN domain-containing protein 7 isoform X1 [Oryzias melastigma]|uniref:BEN domain containing 7 n=1 Tax=Oryzias melastigma TaxID=30732 RepID=A0A3B3BSF4_ORYME|nr:BEN domain-containing protein 7 isoform X1 [Oryzias melastigma]
MELGERRRRRKSQSFKLVADDEVWLEDEGVEIKRQITGMMRILRDKTGRVYKRVGADRDSTTNDSQDKHLSWVQQPPVPSVVPDDRQGNSWVSTGHSEPSVLSPPVPVPNGPHCGQYSTRYRSLRIVNKTKDLSKTNEQNDVLQPAAPETSCCMCNCKGTLEAILQELRAMRRLMQTQKASFGRNDISRFSLGFTPRSLHRRRRSYYKVVPLSDSRGQKVALASVESSALQAASPAESGRREECEKLDSLVLNMNSISPDVSQQKDSGIVSKVHNTSSNQPREPQASESEVRLAEEYDVFISKAQLDSILVNYTRSGSLLFRKLVCAFFNDVTLANSLPNGKRKRGLNDNRKGLDQNIVGAIKVFTEKYCTEHKIEKLPGPRDWVQILQDQIKLARRRLKRDAAETEENPNGPSTSINLI